MLSLDMAYRSFREVLAGFDTASIRRLQSIVVQPEFPLNSCQSGIGRKTSVGATHAHPLNSSPGLVG